MKKKQQITKLMITLLLLVILAGGYVAMTVFMPSEDTEDTEEEEKFTVHTVEEEDIEKIAYINKKEKITLKKQKDDSWIATNDEKCPVNNYTVDAMISTLTKVESSRKIEKKEVDEEEFGFNEPSQEITFTTKDGKETTYTLGAINNVVDKYYFKMTGDENAYLIDTTMYNSFDYDLLGLVELEEYPAIGTQDIADYSLTMDGKTRYFVDSKDAAHKKNDDEIPECVWKVGSNKDSLKKQDTDEASEMVQAIIGLTNSSCVTYNKTDKDMKKYGLDNPKLTLTVNYTEMESAEDEEDTTEKSEDSEEETEEVADAKILDKSFTVYFGNTNEESGEYYVYCEGSKAIYTMNVANVNTLMDAFK